MYINPFLAGIIFTIIFELVLVIAFAIYAGNKKR